MSYDGAILLFVTSHRTPFLNDVFLFITHFGNAHVIIVSTIILFFLLVVANHRRYAYLVLLSVASTTIAVTALKLIFERARPDEALALLQADSFSFPSGHAAMSIALYGGLFHIASHLIRDHRTRGFVHAATLFLIVAIGISRIYLGVHYPTDVLAGFVLGLFCLWSAERITRA